MLYTEVQKSRHAWQADSRLRVRGSAVGEWPGADLTNGEDGREDGREERREDGREDGREDDGLASEHVTAGGTMEGEAREDAGGDGGQRFQEGHECAWPLFTGIGTGGGIGAGIGIDTGMRIRPSR